jgi:hypothetical protein
MSVTDRKMFRPRNARNRLNQLGGIMASSPELMQTVQRFQLGGGVNVRPGARPTVMGMGSGDVPNISQILDFLGVSSLVPGGQTTPGDQTFNQGVETFADTPQSVNLYDPSGRIGFEGNRFDTGTLTEEEAKRISSGLGAIAPKPLSETEQRRAARIQGQPGIIEQFGGRNIPGTLENQKLLDAQLRQRLDAGREIPDPTGIGGPDFNEGAPSGLRQITDPAEIERLIASTQTPADSPNKENPLVEDDIDAQGGVGPGNQGEDSRLTAAKSGELGPKAQVQAVVAAGTPAEQQDQLQQLMNEFTSNAPEYEGIDKGLALAKIGFAMAAGKSPRALENIANALNQGADTFIKDKQERNAFNRQVQLSALQYGLGEVGKERAEERLSDRAGRKPTIWSASRDGDFNGKPFKKGDNVAVPTSYIEEYGVPSGLTNLALAEAAIEQNADVQKALIAAEGAKKMSLSEYTTISTSMNDAAANFASKKTLEELLTKNILQVTEDKITGVQPAFESLVNKAAGAVGIDMGKKYESLEQYQADMITVANQLVNELLGEGSKTLSDTDRKLAQEIVGYYSGQGGYIFRDTDVLQSRLQRTLSTVKNEQATALNKMQEITEATAGLNFPSGRPAKFQSALSVAAPFLNQQQAAQFGLVKGKDNVFRMVK